MAENSKIEWTTHTFNPWIGCQKVSPGCDNCYAEAMMDKRWGKVEWGPHGERKQTSRAYWQQPFRWNEQAARTKTRPRVFCASLADVFDNQVPEAWRIALWAMIATTQHLDWLLLTKRPENVAKMLPFNWYDMDGYPNVWLGATCEDQEHYDRRWRIMREIPAVVRFVSYEPAIGKIFRLTTGGERLPDWIICGGESGPTPRLMDPEWARTARDLCDHHGVAFFMKQMTGRSPIPDDLMVREFPRSRP